VKVPAYHEDRTDDLCRKLSEFYRKDGVPIGPHLHVCWGEGHSTSIHGVDEREVGELSSSVGLNVQSSRVLFQELCAAPNHHTVTNSTTKRQSHVLSQRLVHRKPGKTSISNFTLSFTVCLLCGHFRLTVYSNHDHLHLTTSLEHDHFSCHSYPAFTPPRRHRGDSDRIPFL
jgi:hypothetical protein